MDQRIIDLYDEYTHRPLDRRVFLDRLVAMVGGTAAASAALAVLEPNAAVAQTIAPDDARLSASDVRYSGASPVAGYLVRPRTGARAGAVIVIHENRGLNAHIRDVARRVAVQGFVAFAPDYLTPQGGTPEDADRAREMIARVTPADVIAMTAAAATGLRADPGVNGRIGIVGFCWGGGMVNRLSVGGEGLAAGVVYYGVAPDPADAARVQFPLLVHLASLDARVNGTWPAYETALKAAGKAHTIHMYEGANHAFNNDTSAERYSKAAADLAWERTIGFFRGQFGAAAGAG